MNVLENPAFNVCGSQMHDAESHDVGDASCKQVETSTRDSRPFFDDIEFSICL
jgi:hypothetical protein